jgi:ATP phosphoribosyltransferase
VSSRPSDKKQKKAGIKKPAPSRPHSFSPIVRLAIPNKGRIAAPIMELVEKSGLHLPEAGTERRLITKTLDPHVEILFARPADIPEYVATGAADLGITGLDMVLERGSDVKDLLDLQIGRAKLVLAAREDSGISSARDLEGAKVATEFPVITRDFFRHMGVSVTIVLVGGPVRRPRILGSPMRLSISPVPGPR